MKTFNNDIQKHLKSSVIAGYLFSNIPMPIIIVIYPMCKLILLIKYWANMRVCGV